MTEHTTESLERRYRKIIPDDDARCQCHRWRPLAADALTLLRAKDEEIERLQAAQRSLIRQIADLKGRIFSAANLSILQGDVEELSNDSEG